MIEDVPSIGLGTALEESSALTSASIGEESLAEEVFEEEGWEDTGRESSKPGELGSNGFGDFSLGASFVGSGEANKLSSERGDTRASKSIVADGSNEADNDTAGTSAARPSNSAINESISVSTSPVCGSVG